MPNSGPTTPPPDSDRPLVRRARAGDYDAFDQLVTRYERPLYTLALRITRSQADAEEVVQETFLSVVEHLADFREQSTFHTWLVRIATNHALKVLRKRRTRGTVSLERPQDDGEPPLPHPDFIAHWRDDPQLLAHQREVRELIDAALESLDEKYRTVFLLRDMEGLSTEETAEALGIGISNTKVRLLRARLMLRERLTEALGDPATRVAGGHDHEH